MTKDEETNHKPAATGLAGEGVTAQLRESVVNIGRNKTPETAGLSNFSASPFTLDGVEFGSVEAFIQYIKYPDGSPDKKGIAELAGGRAKKAGKKVNKANYQAIHDARGDFSAVKVYWNGRELMYRSPEHMKLIHRAIEQKFIENPDAMRALQATGDNRITHDLGRPEHPWTSLPASEFCRILMEVRDNTHDSIGVMASE